MKTSTLCPQEVPELNVRKRHHQCENVDVGPPGGAGDGGPGAPTINVKTSTMGTREVPELKVREGVPELKVQERPSPTSKRRRWAPGDVAAEDLAASTVNVKTSMVGLWEVPELKVWERPPST
jgi:hypothetical protein